MTSLTTNVASIVTVIWGSHLSFRMKRKKLSVLFAARFRY